MTDTLREWRESRHHECLLIRGARQVGKTYTVTQFGTSEYKSFISLNFIESPQLKTIFDGDLSSAEIKKRMTLLIPNVRFVPHDTLILLDEIQECPNARTALKFLAQDETVDVIATGSLLGISYAEVASIPVGYERSMRMSGLDFEEYLWAMGFGEAATTLLREHFERLEPLPPSVHERMLGVFREFITLGGMPAVVDTFAKTNNFSEGFAAQQMILNAYLDDIAKYASAADRNKARACFLSIPRQLAKENTKFKYGVVEKKGTARKFETAVDWLVDADIIRRCQAVTTPRFPLRAYEDEGKFRIYMSDTGLLCAMYGFEMMAAVARDELTGPMKGGFYENAVADLLSKAGCDLHYWMSAKGDREIEFLLERNAHIAPVEVKAKRGATASLNSVLERDDVEVGYKLSAGNIGMSGKKVTLPLYMTGYLGRRDMGSALL